MSVIEMPINLVMSEGMRQKFATIIVSKAQSNPILKGIRVDGSYESGFNLPKIDNETLKKANKESAYATYLKYHDSRQLRFGLEDGVIKCLNWKDSAQTWTPEEVAELKRIIYNPGDNFLEMMILL